MNHLPVSAPSPLPPPLRADQAAGRTKCHMKYLDELPPLSPEEAERCAFLRLRGGRRCYTRIGLAACVMLLVYLFLPSMITFFWMLFSGAAFSPAPSEGLSFSLLYLLSALCLYGVAMPVFYLLVRGERALPPPKRPFPAKKLPIAFLLCIPLLYAGAVLGNLVNELLALISGGASSNLVEEATGSMGFGLTLLVVVILAPVFEELTFRKWILDRAGKYGLVPAAALSGLLFGLFHGNFSQFFYALFLGLFFAFLYLRTGRIGLPIALHMLVNFFGSALPMLLEKLNEISFPTLSGSADFLTPYDVVYLLLVLGLLIAGSILLCLARRRLTLPFAPLQIPVGKEDRLLLAPGLLAFIGVSILLFLLSFFS